MKHIVLTLAILVSASAAQAKGQTGWLLAVTGGTMYTSTEVSPAAPSTSSRTVMDLKFGQIMSSGLYWGLVYNSDFVGTDNKGTGYGASLGFFSNGWFGIAHYLLSHERSTSATAKWTNGTGLNAEVGYMFNPSGSFNVGVGFNYSSINYKKDENDLDVDVKLNDTIMPALTLGWVF